MGVIIKLETINGILEALNKIGLELTKNDFEIVLVSTDTLKKFYRTYNIVLGYQKGKTIYLNNEYKLEDIVYVIAHELAHVWQVKNGLVKELSRVAYWEGFADWVSYKVCEFLGYTEQQQTILDTSLNNTYLKCLMFIYLEEHSNTKSVIRYVLTHKNINREEVYKWLKVQQVVK